MLNIINETEDTKNRNQKRYGTNRFEYVWETMIDKVFGIAGKEKYYPSTVWLIDGKQERSSYLRPDTIMHYDSAVLVLDAKYYRYGLTGKTGHLPDSSSTHKQITYGEYIDSKKDEFSEDFGENYTVYNAFLLPFDTTNAPFKDVSEGKPFYRFGESISNWKSNDGDDQPYEHVQGILVDVKYLLNMNLMHSKEEIKELSKTIIGSWGDNKV